LGPDIKILIVAGARPNFVKVAALCKAFASVPEFTLKLVHTGQHYDSNMSAVFFRQLELPPPDYCLGISGGTHTQQTARMMTAFEQVVQQQQPDLVVVVGDVNSTLACALVASNMKIPLAHVEAGLRSGDRSMPEEMNRILTDAVSDYLFVTEQSGLDNLATEGVPDEKVFFTGNCMIDSLVHYRAQSAETRTVQSLGLKPKRYALMTMHRPSNVDTPAGLEAIVQIIEFASRHTDVVFPIHPRTSSALHQFGLYERLSDLPNLHLLEPQGYLEFLNLMEHAEAVMTDSGGIQEETTYLNVPCLTFRSSTERPVTVALGTNALVDDLNPQTACIKLLEALEGNWKQGIIPPLWDGLAADRIAILLLFTDVTQRQKPALRF
jgi:UDP-N-acetylglucosamine 2-epimerase (non-hydrolysing)